MCPLVLDIARLVVPVCVSDVVSSIIVTVPSIATFPTLAAVVSCRMAVSPLRPIWSPVNRTDSTSTYAADDAKDTGPFVLEIVSVGVPLDPVCVIVASSTVRSSAPASDILAFTSVIRSAFPVFMPILLSVMRTDSTSTYADDPPSIFTNAAA